MSAVRVYARVYIRVYTRTPDTFANIIPTFKKTSSSTSDHGKKSNEPAKFTFGLRHEIVCVFFVNLCVVSRYVPLPNRYVVFPLITLYLHLLVYLFNTVFIQ